MNRRRALKAPAPAREGTMEPWGQDRDLTDDVVTRVITAQFAELRPVAVQRLGSGWDNDGYLINDIWVFRFPRRMDVVAGLMLECAQLPAITAALRPWLATPEVAFVGAASGEFPYPFMGYRALPGTTMHERGWHTLDDRTITQTMARCLGHALAALHRVAPVDGVPTSDEDCSSWRVDVTSARSDILGVLPETLRRRTEEWLDRAALPRRFEGARVLAHNDLGPDHVLVDDIGTPTGLIDFGDLALLDPAEEFAYLPCWLGWEGASLAMQAYADDGGSIDPGFRARMSFLAPLLAMSWIGEVVDQGKHPSRKYLRWLDRTLVSPRW